MLSSILARIRSHYPDEKRLELMEIPMFTDIQKLYELSKPRSSMLATLFAGVTQASHLETLTDMLLHTHAVLAKLEDSYIKDGNLHDAAIDAVCELLQQHKKANQILPTQPPKA